MITFNLGTMKGGTKVFESAMAAIEFASHQRALWEDDHFFRNAFHQSPEYSHYYDDILAAWDKSIDLILSLNNNPKQNDNAILGLIQNISELRLIAHESPATRWLREIIEDYGISAAGGAMKVIIGGSDTDSLAGFNIAELEGAFLLWARQQGILPHSAKDYAYSAIKSIEESEKLIKSMLLRTDEAKSEQEHFLHEMSYIRAKEEEQTNFALSKFESTSSELLLKWESNFESLRTTILERVRIQGPVKFWEGVAEKHEAIYKTREYVIPRIGIAGGLLTPAVAWGSYKLAHFVFSDVSSAVRNLNTGLRETWIHELVFSASATVLYLTLFLWMMRVLVRMMLSEHHLGVDARSRAAMAQTYLALISENGSASEADRAIVLASLFRPVTDGLIKDDALPIISPASFLSSKLAG